MKSFVVVLAALTLAFSAQAQSWQWVYPSVQGNDLWAVFALDDQNVWAAGDAGTLLHSTNGGQDWTVIQHNFAEPHLRFEKIYFEDVSHGWALGGDDDLMGHVVCPQLFNTTDGGLNWEIVQVDSFDCVFDMCFMPDSLGWLAGLHSVGNQNTYEIARTTNRGASWTIVLEDTLHFLTINFSDPLNGWTPTHRSTDGGVTWHRISPIIYCPRLLSDIQYTDSLHGYAVSSVSYTLWATSDGGHGWASLSCPVNINAVRFLTDSIGWAAGTGGICKTLNGWQWTLQRNTRGASFYDITTSPNGTGWAVGDGGMIFRTTDAGDNWSLQAGSDVGTVFRGISFADSRRGWAVSPDYSSTYLLCTSDSGFTWTQCPHPARTAYCVFALSPNYLWTGCDSGYVERSPDGGLTWTESTIGNNTCLKQILFTDPLHGWALACDDSTLYRTTDGGATWNQHVFPGLHWINEIAFPDAMHGWIAGGTLLRSTDGGESWALVDSSHGWFTLSFTDISHGWVGAAGGLIHHTTDAGDSWTEQHAVDTLGRGLTLMIRFGDQNNGIVLNYDGSSYILSTADGGNTWQQINLGTDSGPGVADFADGCHAFLGGYNSILRYTAPASSNAGEKTHPVAIPAQFSLSAFPNPFNPSTVISFDVPSRQHLMLSVYDLTGRLVRTLTDRIYNSGQHHLTFDGSTLASGIYFVRLQTPHISKTQKLILLK